MLIGLNLRTIMLLMAFFIGITQWGRTQTVVDGKVSFLIEQKTLTMQEAQNAVNNKTIIPLKVSLIFERGWIDYFDGGGRVRIGASSFAFGIATSNQSKSPLESSNPQAWIYGRDDNCLGDGILLTAPDEGNYASPDWESYCPRPFAYGAGFENRNQNISYRDTLINGKHCYKADIFTLYFSLKSASSIYVRGIDCNDENSQVESTDNENLLLSTAGTTELSLLTSSRANLYWPNGPTTGLGDWTLSGSPDFGGSGQIETDYYGGVIPGGIFIEQVPELTQFERSSMA